MGLVVATLVTLFSLDEYEGVFLAALLTLPAYVISFRILHRIGRRWRIRARKVLAGRLRETSMTIEEEGALMVAEHPPQRRNVTLAVAAELRVSEKEADTLIRNAGRKLAEEGVLDKAQAYHVVGPEKQG